MRRLCCETWARGEIDVTGSFLTTNRGNRVKLVIMDYFTKWPEVIALPNQEAEIVSTLHSSSQILGEPFRGSLGVAFGSRSELLIPHLPGSVPDSGNSKDEKHPCHLNRMAYGRALQPNACGRTGESDEHPSTGLGRTHFFVFVVSASNISTT